MIDILVPVLGRPQNAEPLVESIVQNTAGAFRIIFVCSPLDEKKIEACERLAQDTWIVDWQPGRADYAKKINWAFERSDSEWVFSGADDIRFHPEWDTLALHWGRRYSVIGTNDLHNPGSKRGLHSTHILFKRSYIDKYGGTFDGTGTVFSEAYDHQWVDNEFIQTAQRRRQWHFAKKSVVEHFHPHWGNADWDETYKKAIRQSRRDRELYAERIGKMGRARRR